MGSAQSVENVYQKKLVVICEPDPSDYQDRGLMTSEEELPNIENRWTEYRDVASEPFKNIYFYSQRNHPAMVGYMEEFPSYYVVFQTATLWWSIAKDKHYVVMQKSAIQRDVVNYVYGMPNKFRCLEKEAKGKGSVSTLMNWLHQEKLVSTPYDFYNNNSKHFADNIFNQFNDGELKVNSCPIM